MEDTYSYKLWLGFLFVIFGIIFFLRDYGVFSFKLQHLPFIMVIVGVAFLVPAIKKAEEHFAEKPVKKSKKR